MLMVKVQSTHEKLTTGVYDLDVYDRILNKGTGIAPASYCNPQEVSIYEFLNDQNIKPVDVCQYLADRRLPDTTNQLYLQ